MIKGSIPEEDITLINMYTFNTEAPKHIKGQIDYNIIIVGKFNVPLTSMDISFRQQINKATVVLNDTIDQLYLIDIYTTLHPKIAEYKFFSTLHGKFSRIDHILCHKISLNKINRIEVISSILSDHNGMKLEINYQEKWGEKKSKWRLNSMLLKNTNWSLIKSKRKLKNTSR